MRTEIKERVGTGTDREQSQVQEKRQWGIRDRMGNRGRKEKDRMETEAQRGEKEWKQTWSRLSRGRQEAGTEQEWRQRRDREEGYFDLTDQSKVCEGVSAMKLSNAQVLLPSLLAKDGVKHVLINYIDTKAKCRHRKKMTCKGTLRQVIICLRPEVGKSRPSIKRPR